MELNSQFTKEQLIVTTRALIASQRHIIESGVYGVDVVAFYRQKLAISEIALASLTAEPVAWTDEQELRDVERGGCGYLFTVKPVTPNADPRRVIKLYVTPPAQVVPKTLPCSVELKPGLIIGKGCKTDTLLSALQNRATILKGGAK